MKSYSILLASFLVILVSACSSGPQIVIIPEERYRAMVAYHKAECDLYKQAYTMLNKKEKERSRFAEYCKRLNPKRLYTRQNGQISAPIGSGDTVPLEDKAIFRTLGADTQKAEQKYSSIGKDLYLSLIALGTPEHIAKRLIDSPKFKRAVQTSRKLERTPLPKFQ